MLVAVLFLTVAYFSYYARHLRLVVLVGFCSGLYGFDKTSLLVGAILFRPLSRFPDGLLFALLSRFVMGFVVVAPHHSLLLSQFCLQVLAVPVLHHHRSIFRFPSFSLPGSIS